MDELANDLSCAMIGVDDSSVIGAPGKESDNVSDLTDLLGPPKSARKPTTKTQYSEDALDAKTMLNNLNMVKVDKGSKPSASATASTSLLGCGKHRHNKPVTRSASILLRSKILILSDSDSDEVEPKAGDAEEKSGAQGLSTGLVYNCLSLTRKNRMKKSKRKKGDKERTSNQLTLNPAAFNQYFGKRKRSTTLFSNANEDATQGDNGQKSDFQNQQQMDCDPLSFESSSLSESNCDSDQFVEADDEQSDFYEVIARGGKENPGSRTGAKHISKSKYHQSVPIPKNPFASVASTPSSSFNSLTSSSTAFLWKRRRQNHRTEV